MKNKSIFASILLMTLLCSCQKEKDTGTVSGVGGDKMGEVTVDSFISNNPETKCESHGEETLFEDMPYVTEAGDTIYISATLSDMAEPEIEQTKSAPITSSTSIPGNKFYIYVGDDSGAYKSVHNTSSGSDIVMTQRPINYASSKWSFSETYYWPTSSSKALHFVSLGPANLIDDSYIYKLDDSGYGWQSDHSFKGRYQSRKDDTVTDNDAVNMYDLIYGYDDQSKESHSGSVELKLKHACVGVRFIVGDIFGTIGSISFKNFYKNADFTITTATTAGLTTAGLTWSNWGSANSEFKQVFNKVADDTTKEQPLDETTDESKTFMIVPQVLPNDAEMIIDMKNTLHPENLSFDKICTATGLSKDWTTYQGKIITFRVSSQKANHVSVAFQDRVVDNVKDNLQFTNDGRTPIYIRAVLVGNWLNKDKQVLTSWSENASKIYGVFDRNVSGNGFPNLPTSASEAELKNINWIKGADGFYYYKLILEPSSTASEPLFKSFEVTSKPADNEGSWSTGSGNVSMQITSFEMAILVQAVSAEENGTGILTTTYAKAAWGDAVEAYLTTNYE